MGHTHYAVVKNGADGLTSYHTAAEGSRGLLHSNRAVQP